MLGYPRISEGGRVSFGLFYRWARQLRIGGTMCGNLLRSSGATVVVGGGRETDSPEIGIYLLQSVSIIAGDGLLAQCEEPRRAHRVDGALAPGASVTARHRDSNEVWHGAQSGGNALMPVLRRGEEQRPSCHVH